MSDTPQRVPNSTSAPPAPARPPSAALVAAGRFDDFDELSAAVKGWDLDWCQLDRGPLDAELLQFGTDAALLTRVRFSRRFYQRGAAPPRHAHLRAR